jgi:hypothetical protein
MNEDNRMYDHLNEIYRNAYSDENHIYYPTSIHFEGLDFESSHEMVIELSVRYEEIVNMANNCHRKTIQDSMDDVDWQKEGF